MRNLGRWAAALTVTAFVLSVPASRAFATGPTTKFTIGINAAARTGELTGVDLIARDSSNVQTPDYRGTVHFTSTDPLAILPPDHTFTATEAGGFFPSVTFKTAGTQTVTATDTANASITGVSRTVTVTSPAATSLAIGTIPPSGATVGYPMAIVVTARGTGGGTDMNYRGTVVFSSATDPQAMLPAAYTFTDADKGTHSFCPVPPWTTPNSPCIPSTPTTPAPDNVSFTGGVTFSSIGDSQTVTATDLGHPPLTGTSPPVAVTSGKPSKFQVVGFASVPAKSLIAFTVSALNDHDIATSGYHGTVHFTSSDHAAVLPADYTFTASDAGTYQNVVVTFNTVGKQTVTVTDTGDPSITGTSAPVTVTAAPVVTTTTTSSTTIPGTTTTTAANSTTTSTVGSTTTTLQGSTTTTTRPGGSAGPTASGPSTAHPGGPITVTGSQFPSGQQLRLTMLSTPTALGTTTSDATGAFRVTVTIPIDAALGAHRIVVSTPDGVYEAFVSFTVTSASSAPPTGALAITGASVLQPIRFGGLLVISGALLVGAVRRRLRRLPVR